MAQSDVSKKILKEIEEMNKWIMDWWMGKLEKNEENENRPHQVLTKDIKWIDFQGNVQLYDSVIKGFCGGYGVHKDKTLDSKVFDFNHVKDLGNGNHLVLYREKYTYDSKNWQSKIVSAVFKEDNNAPNGVVWCFLHTMNY